MNSENKNNLPNGYGDFYSMGKVEDKIEERKKEGEDINGFGIYWEKCDTKNDLYTRMPFVVYLDKDKNITISFAHAELE